MAKKKQQKDNIKLSALDREYVSNIITPSETETRGKSYVSWGTNNKYPDYIDNLYENVSTLQTLINGTVDYVCGDKIESSVIKTNSKGHNVSDLVRYLAMDYLKYGGFCLQVIRDAFGGFKSAHYIDLKRLRSDKDNTKFYYSDSWDRWSTKMLEYPAFSSVDKKCLNSIYYFKNTVNTVYSRPIWGAATKACEIESLITDFHLNNIHNGFSASYIINLIGNVPDDTLKAEIEDMFVEKFSSSSNSGRFLLNFAQNKDDAATVEKIDISDFDKQYEALSNRTQQEIFTSFRCNPNLFGISTAQGFNSEEYEKSYELYKKSMVEPIQKRITAAFDKITGVEGSVTITPFTINFNSKQEKITEGKTV